MWRSPSRRRNSKGALQMDKYPYEVQQKLREILEQTDKVAWMFSKEPTKDFSRHRKLPFHKLAEIMIGMEGSSLSRDVEVFSLLSTAAIRPGFYSAAG